MSGPEQRESTGSKIKNKDKAIYSNILDDI